MARIYRPLPAGTQVRLHSAPSGVTLCGTSGVIVGPDPDWSGYYIVRLDEPASYQHSDGSTESLYLIREADDNLDVVSTDR